MAEAGVRRGPLSLLASSQLLNPKMNYLIRQFWSVRKLSNSSFFPWSLTWFLLPSNIYICILSSWLPYHFSWQFTLLVSWAHWKQFCMKLFGCSWVWSSSLWWCFLALSMNQLLKTGYHHSQAVLENLRVSPEQMFIVSRETSQFFVSSVSASARASISLVCPRHVWHDSPENGNNNSLRGWKQEQHFWGALKLWFIKSL